MLGKFLAKKRAARMQFEKEPIMASASAPAGRKIVFQNAEKCFAFN